MGSGLSGPDFDEAQPGLCCALTSPGGGVCCEPAGADTTHTWIYVGEGHGRFDMVKSYNYVGDGYGSFEAEAHTTYHSWQLRLCSKVLIALAAIALVFSMWAGSGPVAALLQDVASEVEGLWAGLTETPADPVAPAPEATGAPAR